jgi:hypothetical protein
MEQNPIGSSESNENNQPPTMNEWSYKYQTTNNDNFEQTLVEKFNDSSINDNSNAGRHDGHSDFTINENTQNLWNNQYESKDNQDNKDNSGYRRERRGGFNKTNHSRSSIEKSWGHDFSNNFQSNSGHTRGRGRGLNFTKKFNEENNSFGDEYNTSFNNQNNITATGYRARGRGGHRGGRGKFRENSGNFNDNDGDGLKIKENKHVPYIPPDIENEESIAGIEAGLNFDKYETIEVKVSGTDPPKSVTSFRSSGLREVLLENLSLNKFSTSTPIQNYSIPIVIAGRDLMASAQTGSGKTVN